MTCQTCGRPAEGEHQGHWLGCEEVAKPAPDNRVREITVEGVCEYPLCARPKWSDGPRTKFCTTHKDPKNREK